MVKNGIKFSFFTTCSCIYHFLGLKNMTQVVSGVLPMISTRKCVSGTIGTSFLGICFIKNHFFHLFQPPPSDTHHGAKTVGWNHFLQEFLGVELEAHTKTQQKSCWFVVYEEFHGITLGLALKHQRCCLPGWRSGPCQATNVEQVYEPL